MGTNGRDQPWSGSSCDSLSRTPSLTRGTQPTLLERICRPLRGISGLHFPESQSGLELQPRLPGVEVLPTTPPRILREPAYISFPYLNST